MKFSHEDELYVVLAREIDVIDADGNETRHLLRDLLNRVSVWSGDKAAFVCLDVGESHEGSDDSGPWTATRIS